MKKHILPGLLLGALMGIAPIQSEGQIRNDRGTFAMPGSGDLLVETQARINLGGGGLFDLNDGFLYNLNSGLDRSGVGVPPFVSSSNYFPMLKVRKFTGNGMAMRFLMNISYNSQRADSGNQNFKVNNFGIAAGAGIEKIFTPAERLNTYVGADLTVGYARIAVNGTGNIDNRQGGFGIGVRGFTGMDYYVLPKVYVGLELGWGISYNNYGVVKYSSGDNDMTNSEFTITPYVTPFFRLGYVLGAGRKMHGNGEPSYRSRDRHDEDDE